MSAVENRGASYPEASTVSSKVSTTGSIIVVLGLGALALVNYDYYTIKKGRCKIDCCTRRESAEEHTDRMLKYFSMMSGAFIGVGAALKYYGPKWENAAPIAK